MNSHLVVFIALAFGHLVVADHVRPVENFGKPPTMWQKVVGSILDKVTGGIEASPHIVGGNEAKPHSHPHQAFLLSRDARERTFACGGSLITPEWVLTAAHCTNGMKSIAVVLGGHDITKEEAERQIIPAQSVVQNHWDPEVNTNDISLIKLSKPATLNQYVQTIRLPAASMRGKNLFKTPVILTGWGRFSDESEQTSPVLREVETTILQTAYCQMKYDVSITNGMVCANGANFKGVCQGDSGGPMVMTEDDGQKSVIGITSFGSATGCEKQYPTVFTRIDQYLDWISEHTGLPIRR